MANFNGTILTTQGRNLLAKALAGAELQFTKIQLGDGIWDENTNPEELTSLVSPKIDLPINELKIVGDGTARIRAVLTNTGLQEGFFTRELGIFAKDPETGEEILYSVSYASNPDYIPADGVTKIEDVIDVYTVIANAQNVTAVISDTVVIATKQDIKQHNTSADAHPDIRQAIQDATGNLSQEIDAKVEAHNQDTNAHMDIRNTISTLQKNPFVIPYSRLQIGSAKPATPQLFDSFYDTTTNTLFLWDGQQWIEIDWVSIVQNSPEFRSGKLRITNGILEISNDGTNWYQVIPTIGATVELLTNGYTVFLLPGQTFVGRNTDTIPIAAVEDSQFEGTYYYPPPSPGNLWFGIIPSGINISDGYGAYVAGSSGKASGNSTSNRTFIPLIEQSGTVSTCDNWAHFSISISNGVMATTSVGHGECGAVVTANIGHGTYPSNGYFIGKWCYEGNPQVVSLFSIRRVA